MSKPEEHITKDNINMYLNEIAKAVRKIYRGSIKIEVILSGGAAILADYNFRDFTDDIDAIMQLNDIVKEAVNKVGDRFSLPNGWFNTDVMTTESYSPRLIEHSKYYKTFCHVLSVRTVAPEYLVAMKLRSGRNYKKDLSDIVGILMEQDNKNNPISLSDVQMAYSELYGPWETAPENKRNFIEKRVFKRLCAYEDLYDEIFSEERELTEELTQFEEKYPNTLTEENIDSVIDSINHKGNTGDDIQTNIPDADDWEI